MALAFQHAGACLTLLFNAVEDNLRGMSERMKHTLGLFNVRLGFLIDPNKSGSPPILTILLAKLSEMQETTPKLIEFYVHSPQIEVYHAMTWQNSDTFGPVLSCKVPYGPVWSNMVHMHMV